jgi:hypothetical protein
MGLNQTMVAQQPQGVIDPNTGKLVKSVGAAPGSNPSQALSGH